MGPDENNARSKIHPKSPGRREWLLRLGETAVLMGLGGAVGDAELDVCPGESSSAADLALPPGLYEPSNDHLSHALSNDTRFHPVPAGTETDYLRPTSGLFQPVFLSSHEFQTVRRIVELVIAPGAAAPGTAAADRRAEPAGACPDKTGGAAVRSDPASRDASAADEVVDEVAQWIDLRLSRAAAVREAAQRLAPDHRALAVACFGPRSAGELETADPQKTSREGLRWLEEESRRRYQKSFVGLGDGEQRELLRAISDDRPNPSLESAGTRLFHWIKGEVIHGYYTSQPGLQELDYRGNAFYPEPPGCEEG
jgi:hypothetical protein